MASLATILRNIEREGPRWGLTGKIVDGKVKVCERVWEIPARARGASTIPVQVERVVCSLDEDSPLDAFTAVLRHRLQRHHHNFARMVQKRRARLQAIVMRELNQRRADFRRRMEREVIRGRIMSVPGAR